MFYPLRRLFAATSLALLSPLVSAHTVWLEVTDSATDYAVRFGGHAGVLEDFPPAKLTEVRAIDEAGEPINITRQDLAAGVRLQTARPASLLTQSVKCVHVYFVNIRTLIAVYLYGHEMSVQKCCQFLILK